MAGLAGYLWGAQSGYINPELMGFHMSAHAIMIAVILGGMVTLPAPSSGRLNIYCMSQGSLPQVGTVNLGKHWQLWMALHRADRHFAPVGCWGWLKTHPALGSAP
jgi:branched-chain amino acid transport system permease protein